jgi:hypothetical protein
MPSKTCYFLSWIMLWACGGYCQLWQLKFLGCILSKTVGVHCFHSSSPAFLALCRRRQFVFFYQTAMGLNFIPPRSPRPSPTGGLQAYSTWPRVLPIGPIAFLNHVLARFVSWAVSWLVTIIWRDDASACVRHPPCLGDTSAGRTPAELLGSRSSLPSSR